MTSRWLTCSSLVLALAAAAPAGSLSGRVELLDSKHPQVRKNKDYSGVVVWLEPIDGVAPRAASRTARMVQKDKTFTPHVLPVLVGTTVDFPNFDPIFHNAFSNYNGQVFDVGLYPPTTSRSVRFTRPGVVRVFCNIHANMSAVIVVVNTPYYATTAANGAWEIPNIPDGDYQLRVFHERATPVTLAALSRRVSVDSDTRALTPMVISEGGYLSIPHKNKYGKEYPPAPDEGSAYPATRK
jgi:plastocyanin